MKAYQLLDSVNSFLESDMEDPSVWYSFRTYLDSTDTRIMLIDMHDANDVDLVTEYIQKKHADLDVEVIHATPLGSTARRRIVVKGLEQKR